VQKGKIRIGWATARVELLKGRPPRCYNCMGRGHVEQACPLPAELRRCFNCSSTAHFAGKCSAPPPCYLCSGAGRVGKAGVGHRPGSQECPPIHPRGRMKEGSARPKDVALGPISGPSDGGKEPVPSIRGDALPPKTEGESKRPREDSESPTLDAFKKKGRGRRSAPTRTRLVAPARELPLKTPRDGNGAGGGSFGQEDGRRGV